MLKDVRYTTVKKKIEERDILYFDQIVKHVPKTVIAHDIGINTTRMDKLLQFPEKFRIEEVYRIAHLIEVEDLLIYQLIREQFIQRLEKKAS